MSPIGFRCPVLAPKSAGYASLISWQLSLLPAALKVPSISLDRILECNENCYKTIKGWGEPSFPTEALEQYSVITQEPHIHPPNQPHERNHGKIPASSCPEPCTKACFESSFPADTLETPDLGGDRNSQNWKFRREEPG